MKKESEQFSDQESQQRFQKLVGIALTSPPKPQKKMTKKGSSAQTKKRGRKRG
jgi:hypothetical protein